ncbi:hypothetical protein L798_12794 [Zootermopsis nevadensis]|uniref:Uncharacterized protein n=1 Tax=Zootermopsis nevadensis TaxID=136037 RepID=A0A067RPZ9_ZOONE|nr:hypothetical protein L798_12794 [Zootermopsis nevadensis]
MATTPCTRCPCKPHCSGDTHRRKWSWWCRYRKLLRWMSRGPHSRWQQRCLDCKAGSSYTWACASKACPSADASESPVLVSGSSSLGSGFRELLLPAPG